MRDGSWGVSEVAWWEESAVSKMGLPGQDRWSWEAQPLKSFPEQFTQESYGDFICLGATQKAWATNGS